MTPAITTYLNSLEKDINGWPIISGNDLAKRIIETEPGDSVQYGMATEFLRFSDATAQESDGNPFIAENNDYTTSEGEFIKNISNL